MKITLKSIAKDAYFISATGQNTIEIANDADPRNINLAGIDRIDLQFPKFTDGRAFSQAFLLRRRLQFKGELRATGDVLIDQLQQMQRCGFDSAVLRADQSLAAAERQLRHITGFYQGDALHQQQPGSPQTTSSTTGTTNLARPGHATAERANP